MAIRITWMCPWFPSTPIVSQLRAATVSPEHQSRLWDFCEFNTLPAESHVANRLTSLLKEKGWSYSDRQKPRCCVALPGDWEAYLAELSSKVRKNYKYYIASSRSSLLARIYRCSSDADWLRLPRRAF